MSTTLLPDGVEVAFADIAAAVERGREDVGRAPARALTATIAAIGPPERLVEAVGVLEGLAHAGAVRAILIPEPSDEKPTARVRGNTVVLNGVKEVFVDNALAALRLSSLPTLVWWRSANADALDRIVDLVDRVVLDADPPDANWARAVRLLDKTAFTDLRWTRLTRWRALLAQFFDMPDVAAVQATFNRLSVRGADRASARLFAAWLASALGNAGLMQFEFAASAGEPISAIRLSGAIDLCLQLAASGRCVQTTAETARQPSTSRVVSVGDNSLPALIAEELRIRSRDRAFEAALARCAAS